MADEDEQRKAIEVITKGHNLLILGQSGTGKSYTANNAAVKLRKAGKTVNITGTTGVAALHVGGVTIHSWSGIGDGRFSNEQLVHKILTNAQFSKYQTNITEADVLIVDEISMLSLKQFNQLEYVCRKVRKEDLLFGGIQVIGCGDFFQLPPVPDVFKQDPGEYCFRSEIFRSVFRHKVVLEKVMRQDEPDLIDCINNVSKGKLGKGSTELLTRLQRPLPPGKTPVRLFARNFDKEIYNFSRLSDLEGDMKSYEAADEGKKNILQKLPATKTLYLKKNCPVMLVKNLSTTLVNGLQGTVLDLNEDFVTVRFENSVSEIKKESFTVYSSVEQKVVASRVQIPLVLSFGVSIHKAQGLSMDRVEVDCSNIFKPGMLGVAIGRARKKKGLRLLNFKLNSVIRPDQAIFDFYEQKSSTVLDFTTACCKIPFYVDQDFEEDYEVLSDESELSEFDSEEIENIDRMLILSENIGESGQSVETEESLPACPIDTKYIRSNLHFETPKTEEQRLIQEGMNLLLDVHEKETNIFLKKIFEKISNMYDIHCGISTEKKTDSKMWTNYHTALYKFTTSEEYITLIESCIHKKAESNDFVIFSKIFDCVSHSILETKASVLATTTKQQTCFTYDSAGLGKLRYIAGRCVAKSKHHFMNIGQNNMYRQNKVALVSACFLKVKILDHFTSTYYELLQSSRYKETLEETKRMQNISQGLTNVKDGVLELFVAIDKVRSGIQTKEYLHIQGSNILDFVHSELSKNDYLFSIFKKLLQEFDWNISCIEINEQSKDTGLKELYEDLIWRFCRVADNQFRKDLMSIFKRQKSDTLRKRVAKPQIGSATTYITMSDIMTDESECKKISHLRLQSLISEKGSSALRNFSKKQLLDLSKAYGILQTIKTDKKTITENLLAEIPKFQSVPNIAALSVQAIPPEKSGSQSEMKRSEAPQPSTSSIQPHSIYMEAQPSTSTQPDYQPFLQEKDTSGQKRKKRRLDYTMKN